MRNNNIEIAVSTDITTQIAYILLWRFWKLCIEDTSLNK